MDIIEQIENSIVKKCSETKVKENYILKTNINNGITITGVAVATAEKSGVKKHYITYNMYNKQQRSEINEQTYNFVNELFKLILCDKEGIPEEYINSQKPLL